VLNQGNNCGQSVLQIDHELPAGGIALGAVREFSEEGPRGNHAAGDLLFASGILPPLAGLVLDACTAATCVSRARSRRSSFPTALYLRNLEGRGNLRLGGCCKSQ